jgi:hypothetical protein
VCEPRAARGSLCIYLAPTRPQSFSVEHRRPGSLRPRMRLTHAYASRLELAQFGAHEPCPFTDCGPVNLGWALATCSQRATRGRAQRAVQCTPASDTVHKSGNITGDGESAVLRGGDAPAPLPSQQPYASWLLARRTSRRRICRYLRIDAAPSRHHARPSAGLARDERASCRTSEACEPAAPTTPQAQPQWGPLRWG